MKRIGIVGSGADKFSELGKQRALELIKSLAVEDTSFVSGHSPMGGVDVWTEEIAEKAGIQMVVFHPQVQKWEGGYKDRNLEIARYSDELHVIVVREYPEGYRGRRFTMCYHCGDASHTKSGGCWTGKRFEEVHPGKKAIWHILENV